MGGGGQYGLGGGYAAGALYYPQPPLEGGGDAAAASGLEEIGGAFLHLDGQADMAAAAASAFDHEIER